MKLSNNYKYSVTIESKTDNYFRGKILISKEINISKILVEAKRLMNWSGIIGKFEDINDSIVFTPNNLSVFMTIVAFK